MVNSEEGESLAMLVSPPPFGIVLVLLRFILAIEMKFCSRGGRNSCVEGHFIHKP